MWFWGVKPLLGRYLGSLEVWRASDAIRGFLRNRILKSTSNNYSKTTEKPQQSRVSRKTIYKTVTRKPPVHYVSLSTLWTSFSLSSSLKLYTIRFKLILGDPTNRLLGSKRGRARKTARFTKQKLHGMGQN